MLTLAEARWQRDSAKVHALKNGRRSAFLPKLIKTIRTPVRILAGFVGVGEVGGGGSTKMWSRQSHGSRQDLFTESLAATIQGSSLRAGPTPPSHLCFNAADCALVGGRSISQSCNASALSEAPVKGPPSARIENGRITKQIDKDTRRIKFKWDLVAATGWGRGGGSN
jgi:hypothetical protein